MVSVEHEGGRRSGWSGWAHAHGWVGDRWVMRLREVGRRRVCCMGKASGGVWDRLHMLFEGDGGYVRWRLAAI
jgi:hypothetical protein